MGEKHWRCTVCGYIHTGENPPEVCPVCGVDSSFFELVAEDVKPQPSDKSVQAGKEGDAQTVPSVTPFKEAGQQSETTPAVLKEIPHGVKPALFKISYGLYIVTSVDGEKINGQCANTVFQITSDPPTVAIGINKNNYTHRFIEASGLVGISILGQDGHDLVRAFGYRSGRDADKFSGVAYRRGETGVPLVEGCIAYLEGKVANKMDCGTHTLYYLEVVNGDLLADSEPMTYAYFRATK